MEHRFNDDIYIFFFIAHKRLNTENIEEPTKELSRLDSLQYGNGTYSIDSELMKRRVR